MIGRTNVGGGSLFSATIQVSTDPNAVITAVNLAGDTFSGTADALGLLNLSVSQPGTYTVTETGGGSKTVVVSDYGEIYQLRIIAFDGMLIYGGEVVVDGGFSAEAYQTGAYTGAAPYISSVTYGDIKYVQIDLPSGGMKSGIYVTTEAVSITDFSTLSLTGFQISGSYCVAFAIDELGEEQWNGSMPTGGGGSATTYSLSSLSTSKKWRFGVWIYDVGHCYVNELKLI